MINSNFFFSQNEVHQVNPRTCTERDPSKRTYRRKEIMQYRDELRAGSLEFVKVRRAKLFRLLTSDAIQQIRWMRDIGYDYMPTQA